MQELEIRTWTGLRGAWTRLSPSVEENSLISSEKGLTVHCFGESKFNAVEEIDEWKDWSRKRNVLTLSERHVQLRLNLKIAAPAKTLLEARTLRQDQVIPNHGTGKSIHEYALNYMRLRPHKAGV
jgi:hypothetical protein